MVYPKVGNEAFCRHILVPPTRDTSTGGEEVIQGGTRQGGSGEIRK